MIALLDGDIICYRAAASCEPNKSGKVEREPLDVALYRCDDMMRRIIHETAATSYKAFISGPDNFRYNIDPQYKANRVDVARPEWLQPVREHLVVTWSAHVSDGIEADDNLGIEQCADNGPEETIICTIDKDLLQVPGRHYNFVTQEWRYVTPHDGWLNFYTQLIMGDRADNIPGYDGKMRQKVPKFLEYAIESLQHMTTPMDMYEFVYDLYMNEGLGVERMQTNAQLLYIQRKENDTWHVPA